MSGSHPAPNVGELPSPPESALASALHAVDPGSWQQQSLDALADIRAIGGRQYGVDGLAKIEEAIANSSPKLAIIVHRVDEALLTQTLGGPEYAKRNWRQLRAVGAFALAMTENSQLVVALEAQDAGSIDRAATYAAYLAGEETTTSGPVFEAMTRNEHFRGLLQADPVVERSAVISILEAEKVGNTNALSVAEPASADFRDGQRLIPAALSQLLGIKPETPPGNEQPPISSVEPDGQNISGGTHEESEAAPIKACTQSELMAVNRYRKVFGPLPEAFEEAQKFESEEIIQKLLADKHLSVIDRVRQAVNGSWHVTQGSPAESYGVTTASNALALSFGNAKPEALHVWQQLFGRLSPDEIDASIRAVLDSPQEAGKQGDKEAMERARAMADLTASLKGSATRSAIGLADACGEIHIKPIKQTHGREVFIFEDGVPLMYDWLSFGLDVSAKQKIDGASRTNKYERIAAAHAGGVLFCAILAKLVEATRATPAQIGPR